MVPAVKNPSDNTGDIRDMGSIPGSVRSLGRGHGNSLQYSCLENPTDRGAIVHRVAELDMTDFHFQGMIVRFGLQNTLQCQFLVLNFKVLEK